MYRQRLAVRRGSDAEPEVPRACAGRAKRGRSGATAAQPPELFAALPADTPEGSTRTINNWHHGDTFSVRKDKLILFEAQAATPLKVSLPDELGGGTGPVQQVARPEFYVYGADGGAEKLVRGAFVGAYRAYVPGLMFDDLWVEHLAGLPDKDPRVAAIRAYQYVKGTPLPPDSRRGIARAETLRDAVMPPGAEEAWIRTALRAAGTSWDDVKKAGDEAQARREAEVRATLEGDAWARMREVARPWSTFRHDDDWALPTDARCGNTPRDTWVADRAKVAAGLSQGAWLLPLDVSVDGNTLAVRSTSFAVVGSWAVDQVVTQDCYEACCPLDGSACSRRSSCSMDEFAVRRCSPSVSRSWKLAPVTLSLPLAPGAPTRDYQAEAVVVVKKAHRDCNQNGAALTVFSGKVLGVRVTRGGGVIHEEIRRPVSVAEALAGAEAFRP